MTVAYGGAAGGAAAAAAIANAIKASGAIVKVEPQDFALIIGRMEAPLVVLAGKTFWSPGFKYLTSYKGLAFFCKSPRELELPGTAELITAKSIWIPG
ncbi:MAG: hypothetical protein OEM41_07725 [Ignavibacteria bacterium]|nr:hypothetical protein [Ignavibacteria bacterium]